MSTSGNIKVLVILIKIVYLTGRRVDGSGKSPEFTTI
jgi:hypothetical protein